MLYAPTGDGKEDWVRDLKKSIAGDFPQEQKDKQLLKQGQELTRKRDDSDTVKKISKKKRAEAEEQRSEEESGSGEEEKEEKEEARRKKEKPKNQERQKQSVRRRSHNQCQFSSLGPIGAD